MPKTWLSPIFEKNFFPAENAWNRCFYRFSSDFFLISLFFHAKTLITMPTIKHGSFVNKTDFCSQNFLKVAGTANFRWKKRYFLNFWAELYIFSWNSAHWCKMVISKMRWSPIFEKHFSSRKCRKYDGKPVFWHFLEISSFVFPGSLRKDAY